MYFCATGDAAHADDVIVAALAFLTLAINEFEGRADAGADGIKLLFGKNVADHIETPFGSRVILTMSDAEENCGKCRFYVDGLCRRRAPHSPVEHIFAAVSMLQAIAICTIGLTRHFTMPPKDGERVFPDDIATIDDNVFKEMTELYEPDKWPEVLETDWCGEFERAPPEKRE